MSLGTQRIGVRWSLSSLIAEIQLVSGIQVGNAPVRRQGADALRPDLSWNVTSLIRFLYPIPCRHTTGEARVP